MLLRPHLPLALLLLLPSMPTAAQAVAANRCTAPAHKMEAKGDPRLVEAVKAGNATLVRDLLGKGADANSTDREGFSVLHSAITEHHNDIVRLLIGKGADVNYSFMGTSPLSLAQMSANDPATELLKKEKARFSDFDLAREQLRKTGIRNFKNGLVDAIQKGDLKTLSVFLRATLDINEPIENGVTPMHAAAIGGSPETIRFLAACGANVNARTKAGAPVLWFARERPENRAALLELGAKDEP